jgi:hypothetical protein
MHGKDSSLGTYTRKLLGFTDNRQDAALQSGHFNDFLFVSLIRAAFLGALDVAGGQGLRSDELGAAQQRALGFDRPVPELRSEWLRDPSSIRGGYPGLGVIHGRTVRQAPWSTRRAMNTGHGTSIDVDVTASAVFRPGRLAYWMLSGASHDAPLPGVESSTVGRLKTISSRG